MDEAAGQISACLPGWDMGTLTARERLHSRRLMSDRSIDPRFDDELLEDVDKEVKEPDMYKVVLHNDDYTTKEFVVEVLQSVFHKPAIEATKIMLDVHKKGKGVVGVYTWDIAQTKVAQVHQLAREREFPLKCTVEPA
jgi:ATP-dependent Clp protease adaptor protein ClpS